MTRKNALFPGILPREMGLRRILRANPRSSLAASFDALELLFALMASQDQPYKLHIGSQIAFQEPLRILYQPVQPLQVKFLHPFRRTPGRSRMEIKRRADPQHNRIDFPPVLIHPPLLLGRPQTYP